MASRMADTSRKALIGSASLGLAVLSFINLFNYLDRYVVSALVESLKHSELALSDAKLGLLVSAFLIVFTLAAPVFGALGDRRSRPHLIAFGVGCWSVATAFSGLASSFATLLAARAAVGIGESAYVTIAPSLLSDYFPRDQRGRVMAIFFCAIPVGSALGYVVGGLIDVHFGWRMAFFVAGIPGLALAALCFGLRDPPRGSQDRESPPEGGAAKSELVCHLSAVAAQQAVSAHHPGICRVHVRIGRPRVLDARISRAHPRHGAQPSHGELWRHRRRHRLHRYLRRGLARRLLRQVFEAGLFVDLRHRDADRGTVHLVRADARRHRRSIWCAW